MLNTEGSKNTNVDMFTFVTATDGNHGISVSYIANLTNSNCYIFLPQNTPSSIVTKINSYNAQVKMVDGNYDHAVMEAKKFSEHKDYILIQDTSWDGYYEIPVFIMQGYLTMIKETINQLGDEIPSHVIIQAGVGSFAATIQAYLCNIFGDMKPKTIIVEPENANSFLETAKDNQGNIKTVNGDLSTIMNSLSCGKPSPIAWKILKDNVDVFFSCSDDVAITGLNMFNNLKLNNSISGTVGLGLLYYLINESRSYKKICNHLNLDNNSKVLLFATE